MSLQKIIVLGALCLGALAIEAGTAEASLSNNTSGWCKSRGAEDQLIVQGGSSKLVWTPNGDVVLRPLNKLVQKIWSSGTAGAGDKVCWDASGMLAVYDASGAKLWSQGGTGTVPEPDFSATYRYKLSPWLSGCDFSARYVIDLRLTPPPIVTWVTDVSHGKLWTREAECPAASQGMVGDDWCLDPPAPGKERPIVQTQWSELMWQSDGTLLHRSTESSPRTLWSTPTAGAGRELCFEPTGRLAVYGDNKSLLWSTPTGTTTMSSHVLDLDDCDLRIRLFEGTGSVWSRANRCPQTTRRNNTSVAVGTVDVVLLENSLARLVYQPDGNVALKTAAGDEVWTSTAQPFRGKRLDFQNDGNLVIYDASNRPVWDSYTAGRGVVILDLDGCAISLKTWSETKWTRGGATCPGAALTNTPARELSASGNLTVLRTPESRLVWQQDGNLVLYTTSGSPVWSSNTVGPGRKLSFQADGNLVIYRPGSTTGSWIPVWDTGTWVPNYGTASYALRLGDHCRFTVTDAPGTSTKWTGNDSCIVVNYTFERSEGDSMFGTRMRSTLVARNDGTPRADSATSVELTLLGAPLPLPLFTGTAYQDLNDSGSDGNNASITVYGESLPKLNMSYEKTFFEKSKTFNVGPVPVFVKIGASGSIGLEMSFASGTLKITPGVDLSATVSAGVGGECDLGGASAGVRGTLTLLAIELPIQLRIYKDGTQAKYELRGDLEISSLSGSLELYAEAFVKICFVKVSADWSYELFSWKGYEWTQNLFTKSGVF